MEEDKVIYFQYRFDKAKSIAGIDLTQWRQIGEYKYVAIFKFAGNQYILFDINAVFKRNLL